MKKLKKGDEVVVITGKNKGQRGRVLRVLPSDGKALVENINIVKKAVRPNPSINQEGGIIEQERAVDLSNLMLYNPTTKKGERVKFSIDDNGKKVRIFKDGTKV